MWRKSTFRQLSSDARYLYLFLMTGPETNLAGLVMYAVDEITGHTGLTEGRVLKAMAELVDTDRILWDQAASLVFVIRWIKHNPLKSPQQIKGAVGQLSAYENHPFHEIATSALSGGLPDRVLIGYREGIDTLQGQGDLNPIQKEKKDTKKEAVFEIGQAMVAVFNDHFNLNRRANQSVVSAIRKALVVVPNATAEDFANVVRMRITEEWFKPETYGVESMIRTDKIAGHIERAKEHTARPQYEGTGPY